MAVHYCGYGAAWKKPTQLSCFKLDGPERLVAECALRGGMCAFSGKPHIVLQGSDQHGVSWTLSAQAYPRPLADRMAAVFVDTAEQIVRSHIFMDCQFKFRKTTTGTEACTCLGLLDRERCLRTLDLSVGGTQPYTFRPAIDRLLCPRRHRTKLWSEQRKPRSCG